MDISIYLFLKEELKSEAETDVVVLKLVGVAAPARYTTATGVAAPATATIHA